MMVNLAVAALEHLRIRKQNTFSLRKIYKNIILNVFQDFYIRVFYQTELSLSNWFIGENSYDSCIIFYF